MKKIGLFCGYYPPHVGGVERYVDKLSTALEKLGYQVVVVTSNPDNQPNHEKVGSRVIYRLPVYNLAKERYPLPKVNKEYKDLIQQIKAEKIDYYIVNTRFHLTSFIGARMGKRQHRPVLLIEHGTDHFTVNNRWLDYVGLVYEHLLTYWLKKYVTRYYGVSKNCNLWLKHFSIQASGVFYNAVDVADGKAVKDYFATTYPKDEIIITYAGRLIREKGILNLLEAFTQVKKQNPDVAMRLVVAGDGALLENIKHDYADPAIDVLGRLDFAHVMALYKRSDIFVYPSLYPEGLPTSILEAGMMECAVIATPRGGTEEVIPDGRHGIIIDGSTASLQEAIEQLVVNPARRHDLADAIKLRIEKVFNWNAVAKEVDREIKSFNVE